MRWLVIGWALAALGSLLSGCELGRFCTKRGYPEGFQLALVRPAWEPAEYRFDGEADGEPFSCTLDRAHVATCLPSNVSHATRLWGDDDRLAFWAHPKHVEVAVRRDGVLLGQGSYRPEYIRDEPNGEGCGVQIFAYAELELPGPTPCGVDESCRCVHDDGCGCETDSVHSWPWSTCPGGTVPADACDPARCTCVAERGVYTASCDRPAPGTGEVCVEGAYVCPDPAFPVHVADCP
jgi:hypothetical protein